jgi:NitT/TauT family transport system substrate-binding protein
MSKKSINLVTVICIFAWMLSGCSGNSKGLTTIKLNESTHSVFYAPLYVAIEKGYFKEEGLKVNLENGSGSDQSMKALLGGDCNISLLGPETSIYGYNGGTKDYAIDFAQLTQHAGNFLVSRDMNEEFSWDNLKGKTVLGGKEDGMPEMVFQYILKKHGIDPMTDLAIVKDIDFGATSQVFASGKGDYTLEFESDASELEKKGLGKVVASLGEDSGQIPFAVFAAKKSLLTKNPKLIQSFTNALQRGLDYVMKQTPEETAKTIQPRFAGTDSKDLVQMVTTYYNQDTWKNNLIFEEGSLVLLQDLMKDAGELSEMVSYENIVNTEFAKNASK